MVYLVVGARALLGVVFLVSLAGKISGRAAFVAFVASVRSLGVLSARLADPVARTVVAGEAAVCVLLVLPSRNASTGGFLVAGALLAAFTAGIAAALRRGNTAPCRCFGAGTSPLGTAHIVRNVVLCAVAGAAVPAVPAVPAGRPGGVAVAVFAGLCAGVVVTRLDHLLDLFRPLPASARAAATARRGSPARPGRAVDPRDHS
ncbi:MauE/DoxX family redox-associated membrane protein [Embleya sp. NPDC059237]|uniref:MauE/DoxX family redox-associated membrane protein n=1 Tax=Embleya sp. NPDC059237 TaxID=3346784 RepID=UPI0036921CAC